MSPIYSRQSLLQVIWFTPRIPPSPFSPSTLSVTASLTLSNYIVIEPIAGRNLLSSPNRANHGPWFLQKNQWQIRSRLYFRSIRSRVFHLYNHRWQQKMNVQKNFILRKCCQLWSFEQFYDLFSIPLLKWFTHLYFWYITAIK